MRSSLIEKILGDISPEKQAEIDKKIEEFLEYQDRLKKDGKFYNTDTSISLEHLRENGFNPIAITQLYLEETFVFETIEEAERAFIIMESERKIITGWWYERHESTKIYSEYCEETGYEPQIYYLNGW